MILAQFWVILGHFAPNLRIDFQKCSQKVPKNDENSMKIFFSAKNILNSSQINLEHLIIRRNIYIRYIWKFSHFWLTFPDSPPDSAFATIYRGIRRPGGDSTMFPCFWPHFALNRAFLSRQEVPGCHKNIYRELRPSFTRSEIFGNTCCCFRQQKQHSVLTLHVDISLWPYPK